VARETVEERVGALPEAPTSPDASWAYLDLTMGVLHRQSAVLSELRTRASIVLSATGIIASLLGSEGLKHPHPAVPLYAALACLGFGILLCIAVLSPVTDHGTTGAGRIWQVTPTASEVAALADIKRGSGEDPGEAVPESLLTTFVTARFVNFDTIARRTNYFNVACVLLLCQLAAWAVVFLT
jgi:hypothetical protein